MACSKRLVCTRAGMNAFVQRDEPRALVPAVPDFLTPSWFSRANVTALRQHLKCFIFQEMLAQVGGGRRAPGCAAGKVSVGCLRSFIVRWVAAAGP